MENQERMEAGELIREKLLKNYPWIQDLQDEKAPTGNKVKMEPSYYQQVLKIYRVVGLQKTMIKLNLEIIVNFKEGENLYLRIIWMGFKTR